MNEQLKNNILHMAKKIGCDIDGDLFYYDGKTYYVHIFYGIVIEQKRN